MRSLIAVIVIVYLIGVAVVLAPLFQARWNSGTPAELSNAVVYALPGAFGWPVQLYHRLADPVPPAPTPTADQTVK